MERVDVGLLHQRLLNLLLQFHDFCERHSLTYYAVGGTALGMRRHKGFIPWDDDVDVAMPRESYERLTALINELPENVEIKYYKNTANYPHHALKFIDKNTTLIENNYTNIIGGLYLDVFPLDGVLKSSRKDRRRRIKIYHTMRDIMWHCSTKKHKSFIRKAYSFYCKRLSLPKLHAKLENLIKQVPYTESEFVANLLGVYGERELVKKEMFGHPTLYDFEGMHLYGPEHIDSFLTSIYGDFMELPPEPERVLHHSYYFLDLNTPYEEFISNKKNPQN